MSKPTKDQVKHILRNNPFTYRHYRLSTSIPRILKDILSYTHASLDNPDINRTTLEELPFNTVFEAIPPFQRDNDKWTQAMQVAFVENVLKGYSSDIMLFEVGDTAMCECQILDGLQRLTAVYRFMAGEIKAFGWTAQELLDERVINRNSGRLSILVYSFDTMADAINFYVAMNENITHSKADIERALACLEKKD